MATLLDPNPYYLFHYPSRDATSSATYLCLASECIVAYFQIVNFYSKRQNKLVDKEIEISKNFLKKLRWVTISYLVSMPAMVAYLGGSKFLFKKVRIADTADVLNSPFNAMLLAIILATPVILFLSLIYLRQNKLMPVNRNYLICLFIWILILANPIGNPRQVTLFMLLPTIFYWLHDHKTLSKLFFLLLPFLLTFSANPINRYTGAFQTPRLLSISRNGDYDAFSQFANSISLSNQNVFPIFKQILGSILFFVPRTFWLTKPNDTGVEIAKQLGLHFQNLSSPWIAEAYVNARIPGVILVSAIIGIYLTRIDLKSKSNILHYLVSGIMAGVLFIVLRGSLLQATGRVAFTTCLIYFLCSNPKLKENYY